MPPKKSPEAKESKRGKGIMKKIDARDQTKELSRATWEFLQRNGRAKEKHEKETKTFRDWYERQRAEEAAKLQKHPDMREAYKKLGKEPMTGCDEILKESMQRVAAEAYYPWMEFLDENMDAFLNGRLSDPQINMKMFQILLRDAKTTFRWLTHNEPLHTLLVGIDMRRTKAAIIGEVEAIVDEYQAFYRGNDHAPARLKWLPIVDELLEVWDLYDQAGKQPGKKTFREISRKVGRLRIPTQTGHRFRFKAATQYD